MAFKGTDAQGAGQADTCTNWAPRRTAPVPGMTRRSSDPRAHSLHQRTTRKRNTLGVVLGKEEVWTGTMWVAGLQTFCFYIPREFSKAMCSLHVFKSISKNFHLKFM